MTIVACNSTDDLDLPTTSPVFVYVCSVKSPTDIAIRIIDEAYSVETLGLLLLFAMFV